MEIETVAAQTPEKIRKIWVSPSSGVDADAARRIAEEIGIPPAARDAAADMMKNLYQLFIESDASLVEINPLVVTTDGKLLALDGKITFDDNALFRHPQHAELRDDDEESPAEAEAGRHELSYIELDGNIGCMVNGAGLAMATMDIIKLYGGEPANFLDVGGGATAEKVAAAFKLMLANKGIRAILINIFGGIMRCDVIADGVVSAVREVGLSIPLVVRLEGTNVAEGRKILTESGLSIISADSMSDAAEKAARAAQG